MASKKTNPEMGAGEAEAMPVHALDLIKKDHRTVSALFKQFEQAEGDEKVNLAQQICTELTVHAEMEEREFYPAARKALGGAEGEELIDQAAVEHRSLKMLIAEIDGQSADEVLFEANMKVLEEYVEHHVKEEEREIFPRLKSAGIDLDALGLRLAEVKRELLQQVSPPRHRAGTKVKVHVPELTSGRGRSRGGAAKARGGRRAEGARAGQSAHR